MHSSSGFTLLPVTRTDTVAAFYSQVLLLVLSLSHAMSRIQPLGSDDAPDEEVQQRLATAEDGWYGDAAFFGAMAHAPVLFTRLYDTLDAFSSGEHITPELLELMRLRIATVHECALGLARSLDPASSGLI